MAITIALNTKKTLNGVLIRVFMIFDKRGNEIKIGDWVKYNPYNDSEVTLGKIERIDGSNIVYMFFRPHIKHGGWWVRHGIEVELATQDEIMMHLLEN